MTTTADPGGRIVVKGLHRERDLRLGPSGRVRGQLIAIDERRTYQRFLGGGASLTDSAAWLLGSSNALGSSARRSVMLRLFDPAKGIGLGFLRNPMGASDLTRYLYSYDDSCCDLADFSIGHDLVDVVPLTREARALNPRLTLMMSPWSPPGWMKSSGSMIGGVLKPEYYGLYADYFVRTIEAYAAAGVPVDYVSMQNEPGCCGPSSSYPTMNWTGEEMKSFLLRDLWPAFRKAGIRTRVLAVDWNWSNYRELGAPLLSDPAVRGDPLFGGIAWHGYDQPPDYAMQSRVHASYPRVEQLETEHSGGTWVANQERQDFREIVGLMRNWGRSFVKWGLALDESHGPHTGGCGTCIGLVTVHREDSRAGQVDYTIEYYTMGHLTKFVRPGAYRIASTKAGKVLDVAFKNPDGSKVLIAYNDSSGPRTVTVRWRSESFRYRIPAGAGVTFAWR
jgi:glucosylceramidase